MDPSDILTKTAPFTRCWRGRARKTARARSAAAAEVALPVVPRSSIVEQADTKSGDRTTTDSAGSTTTTTTNAKDNPKTIGDTGQ